MERDNDSSLLTVSSEEIPQEKGHGDERQRSVPHLNHNEMLRLIGCPSCKSQFAIPDPSAAPTFSGSETVFVEELSLHCSHCDTVFLLQSNPFFAQIGEFITTDELHSHGLHTPRSMVESNTETHGVKSLEPLETEEPQEQRVLEDTVNPEIEEDIFEDEEWRRPTQESLFTFTEESPPHDFSNAKELREEGYIIEDEVSSFGEWESPADDKDSALLITEEELWETPLSETDPLRSTAEWRAAEGEPEEVESEDDIFLDFERGSSEEFYHEEQPNLPVQSGYEREDHEFLKSGDIFKANNVDEEHFETSVSGEDLDSEALLSEGSDSTILGWEETEYEASDPHSDEIRDLPDDIREEHPLLQEEMLSDVFYEHVKESPQTPRDSRSFFYEEAEEDFHPESQNVTPNKFAQVISIANPESSEAEEESGSEVRYEHSAHHSKTLSSHSTTTLFTALIVLILVGLGGFSVFLESDGPYQQRIKALVSRDLPLPASHRITLDQVMMKKHVLPSGEAIFSIDAQLENGEDFSVAQIIGEGALYDSQGVLLMKRQLPLGKFLALQQGVKGADEAFSLQEQFSNRSTRVKAQERRKVRILFRANEVQNAHFFTMRPLAIYR
ncbi:MAG: hypothetical protein ACO3XO_06800 [Bdellovibrionota bacterium]